MNGDFARVFDAALNDRPREVIAALGELTEAELVRVVDASKLVGVEGRLLGYVWYGWAKAPVSEGRTGRSS